VRYGVRENLGPFPTAGAKTSPLVLQLYINAYFAMCSGSGDLMLAPPT